MSDNSRDDIDLATAAEQSSEVEENQEGDVETGEGRSVESAEERAISIEGDDDESLGLSSEPDDGTVDAGLDEALTALQEEPAEVDPYEAFKAELRMKPGKWYVIHSYAGFERRVKSNIENRMVSMSMEDYIYQVEVPMEDVVEIKNGQRKLVTRVRIPSYVLVRMDLNEDSWSVVRHTPGVTGFVGNAHNPTPLRFDEAFGMLKSLVQVAEAAPTKGGAKGSGLQAQPAAEVDFEIGETITIKEGSFAGLPGSISEIKPESGKLTVLVSLFERETPVELSFDQVTKL
ncbi:MAG: transcription termination/antitermination factor NusG [Microbacterium sp.]|nr:transcription termination/antitermination factor NusG [Microbacterium sp.]